MALIYNVRRGWCTWSKFFPGILYILDENSWKLRKISGIFFGEIWFQWVNHPLNVLKRRIIILLLYSFLPIQTHRSHSVFFLIFKMDVLLLFAVHFFCLTINYISLTHFIFEYWNLILFFVDVYSYLASHSHHRNACEQKRENGYKSHFRKFLGLNWFKLRI